MIFIRILIAFAVLMVISIILQFGTVPFSSVHNTFELIESLERCVGGIIVGTLIWTAIRLVKGEQNAPEISLFIFNIAVFFLVGRAIYDLIA